MIRNAVEVKRKISASYSDAKETKDNSFPIVLPQLLDHFHSSWGTKWWENGARTLPQNKKKKKKNAHKKNILINFRSVEEVKPSSHVDLTEKKMDPPQILPCAVLRSPPPPLSLSIYLSFSRALSPFASIQCASPLSVRFWTLLSTAWENRGNFLKLEGGESCLQLLELISREGAVEAFHSGTEKTLLL